MFLALKDSLGLVLLFFPIWGCEMGHHISHTLSLVHTHTHIIIVVSLSGNWELGLFVVLSSVSFFDLVVLWNFCP